MEAIVNRDPIEVVEYILNHESPEKKHITYCLENDLSSIIKLFLSYNFTEDDLLLLLEKCRSISNWIY